MIKVRLSAAEHARLGQLAAAWGIATRAGMLRALLRGAGAPDDVLIPGSGLDMMLAEIAELDASESRSSPETRPSARLKPAPKAGSPSIRNKALS